MLHRFFPVPGILLLLSLPLRPHTIPVIQHMKKSFSSFSRYFHLASTWLPQIPLICKKGRGIRHQVTKKAKNEIKLGFFLYILHAAGNELKKKGH